MQMKMRERMTTGRGREWKKDEENVSGMDCFRAAAESAAEFEVRDAKERALDLSGAELGGDATESRRKARSLGKSALPNIFELQM